MSTFAIFSIPPYPLHRRTNKIGTNRLSPIIPPTSTALPATPPQPSNVLDPIKGSFPRHQQHEFPAKKSTPGLDASAQNKDPEAGLPSGGSAATWSEIRGWI